MDILKGANTLKTLGVLKLTESARGWVYNVQCDLFHLSNVSQTKRVCKVA